MRVSELREGRIYILADGRLKRLVELPGQAYSFGSIKGISTTCRMRTPAGYTYWCFPEEILREADAEDLRMYLTAYKARFGPDAHSRAIAEWLKEVEGSG